MTNENKDNTEDKDQENTSQQVVRTDTEKEHNEGIMAPLVEMIEEDLEKINTEFPLSGGETNEDLAHVQHARKHDTDNK